MAGTNELHDVLSHRSSDSRSSRRRSGKRSTSEPVEFFHGLIRENRPFTDCLDADYTYVNGDARQALWPRGGGRGSDATRQPGR